MTTERARIGSACLTAGHAACDGDGRAYLEVHLPELVAPLDEEGEANVEVELAEGVAPLSLR